MAEYPKVAVFDMPAVTPDMWQSLWEQKKEATKQLEEDYAQKLKDNKVPTIFTLEKMVHDVLVLVRTTQHKHFINKSLSLLGESWYAKY